MGHKKNKKDPQDHEPSCQQLKTDIESLQERLEALQSERDEFFNKLQRVSADYANYQKRVPKQIADSISFEKERILKGLLPVLDNFEHTLQNAATADSMEIIVKGVQIINDQMLDLLKGHGVEPIVAKGRSFDPALHEAMLQQCDPEQEHQVVLEEYQRGYTLNGRTIRPSKVVVNKLDIPQPAEGQAAVTQDTDAATASADDDPEAQE